MSLHHPPWTAWKSPKTISTVYELPPNLTSLTPIGEGIAIVQVQLSKATVRLAQILNKHCTPHRDKVMRHDR
jgi:hypothetical protein